MQTRKFILGTATWLSLIACGVLAVQSQFAASGRGASETVAGIAGWLSGAPQEYSAVSATDLLLAPGDPIFLKAADGRFRQVGRVRNNFAPPPTDLSKPASALVAAFTRPSMKLFRWVISWSITPHQPRWIGLPPHFSLRSDSSRLPRSLPGTGSCIARRSC